MNIDMLALTKNHPNNKLG